ALFQILAVSLHGGDERPEVHAVGADADSAAAAAGAERQDLVETVEQAGPLLLIDEPFELRPVRGGLRVGQPLAGVFERLFLQSVVGGEAAEAVGGERETVHVAVPRGCEIQVVGRWTVLYQPLSPAATLEIVEALRRRSFLLYSQ